MLYQHFRRSKIAGSTHAPFVKTPSGMESRWECVVFLLVPSTQTNTTSQTVVFIKTVKDHHAFRLTFQIPDQAPLYKTRPAVFVGHFVGHEGPGSVCAYLKKKGWLVDLSAGSSTDNRSVPTFNISGTLTKEGYRKHSFVDVLHGLALISSRSTLP